MGRLRPLAALALVAVIGAGCSTGSPGTGMSAGGAGTASPAASGGTASDVHQQAVRFAECMRGNGVSSFPDPDASGSFTIETVANGTSIDTNSAAFQQAIGACRGLEPPGFTGATRSPAQQQAALRFAQCIRDNGVKDFPDPGIADPLVDTTRIPSTRTTAGMTILHAAMQTCRGLAGAAGVTGPQP